MTSRLGSLRRKLLGETWTIPLGVGAALVVARLGHAVVPHSEWQTAGGFVLAAVLIATLIRSLPVRQPPPPKSRRLGPTPPTDDKD